MEVRGRECNGRVEGQLTVPFHLAITPLLSVSAQRLSDVSKTRTSNKRHKSCQNRVVFSSYKADSSSVQSRRSYNTFGSSSSLPRDLCIPDGSYCKSGAGKNDPVDILGQHSIAVFSDCQSSDESVFESDGEGGSSGYDTRHSSAFPTPLPTLQMHGRFTRELRQYAKTEAARLRAEKERQKEVEDEFRRYQENTICHRIKGKNWLFGKGESNWKIGI